MNILIELQQLTNRMNAAPEPIQSLNAVYQFDLGEAGVYHVTFLHGNAHTAEGPAESADCTLIMSEDHFRKLLKDELNTTMAFMMRTLKVEGKVGLALKLQEIVKQYVP